MIRELIEGTGISNRELSRRLIERYGKDGVSANTIERWCNSSGNPRLSDLRMLADYFGVPLVTFFPDAASSETLSEDEQFALELYRSMREQEGKPSKALKRLAKLTYGAPAAEPAKKEEEIPEPYAPSSPRRRLPP